MLFLSQPIPRPRTDRLYQSEVSQLVEDCLTPLARKYVNTRFVKLHYRDAEMEPAGVPALLAYRAGDKFAGLVPVVDEIPDDADLSSRTLERVMQRYVSTVFVLCGWTQCAVVLFFAASSRRKTGLALRRVADTSSIHRHQIL